MRPHQLQRRELLDPKELSVGRRTPIANHGQMRCCPGRLDVYASTTRQKIGVSAIAAAPAGLSTTTAPFLSSQQGGCPPQGAEGLITSFTLTFPMFDLRHSHSSDASHQKKGGQYKTRRPV